MIQSKNMKTIKVRHTNDLANAQEDFSGRFLSNRFTLKGRLEFAKDYKAVLLALMQVDGVVKISYDWMKDNAVQIGWEIGRDGNIEQSRIDEVQIMVNDFINHLVNVCQDPMLDSQGIEIHVFIGSLKAIDEYDGERNGPLV